MESTRVKWAVLALIGECSRRSGKNERPKWRFFNMDATDRFVAWCRNEQASLRQQLRLLESGELTTGERGRNTTEETKEEVQRKLAELESLLG
jgi:hypothetical protein